MTIFLSVIAAILLLACVAVMVDRRAVKRHADRLEADLKQSSDEATALKLDNVRLTERLAAVEDMRVQHDAAMETRFKALSSDILTNIAEGQRRRHSEELEGILTPLKTDIAEFRKKIGECYDQEGREFFSLKERIAELVSLNNSVRSETQQLSSALRGSSRIQGDWGELVLETILQNSGLKKGIHYDVQQVNHSDEGARLRPDVVVYFPERRCVVVDSKVSLTAYMKYIEAKDQETARLAGEQHLQSVKKHINELRSKNYQDIVGDRHTDFVMMFIPNEPAYLAAMRLDPTLWQQAYDARVVIVSPTHLISALRLIEQVWRYESYNTQAAKIATEAGMMYDKFVTFYDEMQKVVSALDRARDTCKNAVKLLYTGRGNLVNRANRLREMGISSKKSLPEGLGDEE